MVPFTPKAILFDLDGTLLDTLADLTAGVNGMLAELGQPTRSEQEVRRFVGRGFARLVECSLTEGRPEYILDEQGLEHASALFRRHYAQHNGERTYPYPGIKAVLGQLAAQDKLLAVVTNKMEAFTLPLLEQLGILQHFSAIVAGDTCNTRKPSPEMPLLACEKLGVEPHQALMIGDSHHDAQAARSAGIPVLLVSWGYSEGQPVDQVDCDGVLHSADELFDWIAPEPVRANIAQYTTA
ncbi:MAG: phosphoglycolate phosphatase [Rhodocyclaceae bacterium]|nr:phosphoglycolate phosphatase [Rhodocyclaceae bacterium]